MKEQARPGVAREPGSRATPEDREEDRAFEVIMDVWIDRVFSGVQATPGEHVAAFVRALRDANLIT